MLARMSVEPPQRPGGRSARITHAVREAALATLLDVGLDGFSVEEVARRAEVAKTTIYRRWRTRDNLVADAVAANSEQQIPVPDTGSVHGDLLALALRVRDAVTNEASRRLMAALAAGAHDQLAALSERFWAARLGAARPIIDRAIARDELPPDVDPDDLVVRVVGPIWFAVFGPGRHPDDDFVATTVSTVLAGYQRR